MSEPLTLAEVEREAKSIHLRAATQRQFREEMRTLILRVLAAERERCAEAVIHAGYQYDHLKRRYLPDAVHGAVSAIRAMGDPTP